MLLNECYLSTYNYCMNNFENNFEIQKKIIAMKIVLNKSEVNYIVKRKWFVNVT